MQHFFFFIIAPLRGGARCAALLLGLGAAGPAAWGQNYFTPATITPTGANSVPRSVAVADVNRDGNPDALTANSASNTLGVLLGNGVGGFALQTNTPSTGVNSTPRSVAVADINGDGRPDVLTANSASNTLGVLLGDGAGGFALQANAPSTGVNSGPVSVTVADVNSDGRPDALTINGTNSTLGVLLGDGTGSFALQTNAPSTGAYGAPQSIALADVNSDGRLDVLTVNYTSSTLGVLLGNGAGGFGPATPFPVGANPVAVAVADFNGDGNPDLVTANLFGNNVTVLLGSATGGFGTPTAFAVGIFPQAVAVGDFNRDGSPDLAVANADSANVSVLLNTCVQAESPTPTTTSTSTRTSTPVPPSGTPVPPTATGSSTPTRTGTAVPPSFTTTVQPPTATSTATSSSTRTATATAGLATATATGTVALPSVTQPATRPPTGTPSATSVPSVTPTAVATATPCPTRFSDVTDPTAYYYQGVYSLACRGVISGYSDGTYRPFNNTTRGQMTKIVTLAFNLALVTPSATGTFADVDPSSVFYGLIETAAARGIVSGYTCGGVNSQTGVPEPCDSTRRPYFRPSNFVSRGQLAKIVVLGAGFPLINPPTPTFTDVAPDNVFYPAIETAVCHGIISGYNDHTFRPNNYAFRGQIAKIVYLAVTNAPTCAAGLAPARRR